MADNKLSSIQKLMKEMIKDGKDYINKMKKYADLEVVLDPEEHPDVDDKEEMKKEG